VDEESAGTRAMSKDGGEGGRLRARRGALPAQDGDAALLGSACREGGRSPRAVRGTDSA